jgi:hypothetical protein
MAFHSEQNLYPGINPHLNSYLQSEGGGWESFHAEHIIAMARTLDQILPSNYYAVAEKSLQISEIGLAAESQRRTRPDVSVYQYGDIPEKSTVSSSAVTAPTAVLALTETLEDEDDILSGVVIYELVDRQVPGHIITRLELLSPANKPPQAYYRQYMAKRLQTLRSGVALVEFDYLHHQRPILATLPSYPDHDDGAYPYMILVSTPYPTLEKGRVSLYGFGVDDRLPVVSIPLSGDDKVMLNLGAVYTRTYEGVRLYRMVVDYEQEPADFDRYHETDQKRIQQQMTEIARLYHSAG